MGNKNINTTNETVGTAAFIGGEADAQQYYLVVINSQLHSTL